MGFIRGAALFGPGDPSSPAPRAGTGPHSTFNPSGSPP